MPGFTSTKTFRIIVWAASILLIILIAAYFIIIHNAESLVQRLVAYESNGKFKITVEKIRFHPFQRRIDLINISFQSDYIVQDETAFEFTGDKISLQLSHIRPLIFRKQLLVDSILFESPRLKIIEKSVRRGWGTGSTKKITLHEVLGDVYVKMQNLFRVLYVKRGEINNGELTIAESTDPSHPTISLSQIDFLLERLNVKKGNNHPDEEFMFSENITFHTGPESIDLPDGLHHLSFSQLTLNTGKRYIEIDNCRIHGISKNNPENKFDIFNKKLKFVNLDFAALYSGNIIKADSVYCSEPDLILELGHSNKPNPEAKNKYTYDTLQQIVKMVTGHLAVRYLGIIDANINTFYSINNKVNNFSTSHASFELYDLNVNTLSDMPATVSRVDFALRNYKGYSPDSMYIIKFDSIRLLSDRLILWNASLFPDKKYSPKYYKDLHIEKFELTDVNWLDLLMKKRITANHAFLKGAYVKIYAEKKNKSKVKGSLMDAIHSINSSMNVKDLLISNATIEYEVKDRLSLNFQNANVKISVQDFIKADSIEHMQGSLKQFTADKGVLKTKKMTAILSGISFSSRDSDWAIQKMQMQHEKGIAINAENVFIVGFKKTGDELFINGMGWKKATVNVRPVPMNTEKQDAPKKTLRIEIGRVDFANTAFSLEKNDKKINSFINYIRGTSILSAKEIEMRDLHISGNNIFFEAANEKFKTGAFFVQQNAPSWLKTLSFIQHKQQSDMNLQAEEFNFKPDINQLLQKKYVIRDIIVQDPSVRYTRENISGDSAETGNTTASLPLIDINSILLIKPSIMMENKGGKKTHLDLRGNEITIKNIKSSSKRFDAGSITAGINYLQFINGDGINIQSVNGRIEAGIDAAHFNIEKDSLQSQWEILVGCLSVSNIEYDKRKSDSASMHAHLQSFVLNDFLAKEKSMKNFEHIVRDNPHADIHNATIAIHTASTNLYCRNLQYKNKEMMLDSLAVIPVLNRDAFNATSIFQKDYIQVYTGNIAARGVDLLRYAKEKKLVIENVIVSEPVLDVYKDKRMVFMTGIIKPLPVKAVSKIPLPVFVDTVNIAGGHISYTETSEKTNKTGTISFSKLNAWIHPLKNFDFQSTDSLRLRAEALMFDNIQVALRVKESYTDSLAGFSMTVGIKPADLPVLNPVLEPLASVQVGSGKLDHLEMRAVGREYISFGEMKFYYHDLKIKILKNGELEKKSFLTSMATFVANKFVIHTNNSSRDGRVFFIRNRERSIFNYWLKMTLTGVASSAGAKSNRKLLRKYKQEIKKKQLLPISLD